MKFYFACKGIDEFFANVPPGYTEQKNRKLSLLKRHGLKACLGSSFLREATLSQAPANYVLLLQEPGYETIFVLLRWFQDGDGEAIFFIGIIPEKFHYQAS